jgi:uncharacterized protein (DUF4415 family)
MTSKQPKRLSRSEKRGMNGLLNLGPDYREAETPPDPDQLADWSRAAPQEAAHKTPISLRIDPDVLAFFKSDGPGYQTRINTVLRAYVKAQKAFRKP